LRDAQKWMSELAAYGCDGIVAKLKNEPYHSGDRDAWLRSSACEPRIA
jgi:ATP-dependent DNA ligase